MSWILESNFCSWSLLKSFQTQNLWALNNVVSECFVIFNHPYPSWWFMVHYNDRQDVDTKQFLNSFTREWSRLIGSMGRLYIYLLIFYKNLSHSCRYLYSTRQPWIRNGRCCSIGSFPLIKLYFSCVQKLFPDFVKLNKTARWISLTVLIKQSSTYSAKGPWSHEVRVSTLFFL